MCLFVVTKMKTVKATNLFSDVEQFHTFSIQVRNRNITLVALIRTSIYDLIETINRSILD